MASEGGGKIKNKRGSSSKKPYERRKSLFRRITDSIKDVLRPSWLASQGDGETVEVEDSTAGTSEETGNEETVAVSGHLQANSSQSELRAGSTPLYSDRSSNASQNSQCQQTAKESVSFAGHGQAVGVRQPTWGNTFGMFDKDNFVQKHSEGARMLDNTMDMSAVGLGGLPPAPSTSTTAPEPSFPTPCASATPTKRLRLPVPGHPLSAASSFQQQAEKSVYSQDESSLLLPEDNPSKRQRLWSPEMSRKGRSFQTTPQNRPSFKISVFCSSSSPNKSLHESPFYSGKTTYGGASAYRRQSLNSSLPYSSSLPIRKSVTPKPLTNPGSVVLSSSANQILKTLERLSNAKKTDASVTESESQSLLSFTPKSYRRPSRPIQTSIPSRSVIVPSYGPPVGQMNSPTPARLQPNRQVVSVPVQARASAVASAPLTEEDEDQMTVTQVPEPLAASAERVGHGSGKMKHQKSYATRKKPGRPEDEEVVEAPSLRTDFTLPVQSLATFNLNMPLVSSAVSSAGNAMKGWQSTSLSAVPSSSTLSATSSQCQSKQQFTFSSPIQKTAPEAPGPPASRSSPAVNFQFSIPLSVGQGESACRQQQSQHAETEAVVKGSTLASPFVPPAWGSTAPKPKQNLSENSSGAGFTFGNHEAVKTVNAASNGGLRPSSELKTGSVMDILGSSKNTDALTSSSIKPAATLKQGSVMDLLGGNVGKKSESSGVENSNLLAKFAPAAGSWECDSCMLQNKPEASRCAACETAKPGAAKSGSSAAPSKFSSSASENLLAKFAAPLGSWECDSCLLQNVPEATKCVACETRKPGAAKPAAPSTDSLMAKFKKPEGSWECDVCMVQNTAAQSKCLACESPRPGAKPSGSSPPSVFSSVPTIGSIGSGGGLVLGSIPSSTASPFLASTSADKGSSAAGFSGFGATVTSTAAGFGTANPAAPGLTSFGAVTAAPVGFIFGAPASVAKDSNSVSTNSSNLNNSSAALGFRFGSQDAASSADLTVPGGSSFGSRDTSNSKDFSAPAGFTFGSQDTSDSKGSSAPGGFKFGSQDTSNVKNSSAAGGFRFGSQDTSNSKDSSVPRGFTFDSKVTPDPNCASLPTSEIKTSSNLSSVTVSKSESAGGFKFGDSTSVSSALPSTGGFVFGQLAPSTVQTAASTVPPLAPAVATTPAFSFGSTTAEVRPVTQPSSSIAVGSTDNTFKPVFGVAKPGNSLPLGAAPSLGGGGTGLTQGGFSFKPSSSASSETSNAKGGFGFVSDDRTASGASQGSLAKPFTFNAPAVDKPAVNGELAGAPVFTFGQQATSAPVGGFSLPPANKTFVFGADTASKSEKPPHPDNDLGPSASKKGFGFANPSASVSSSFKLGQTDDSSAKPSGIFGAPASSFGGSGQSSFALAGAQSNAGSSSLFGAGGGSSSASQGQFSFSFGAAGQNSAAAASSFGSESTSATGFSFKPTKSFNFGSATPGVFQFGNSTETATSQPALSTAPFMFGTGSQSADSTSSASGFSAAPAFGAAQPSFNIGAGTGDNRKIKKAVRRTVRK